ncbi:MAG: RNA-directed DNA polymerase, partial [Planctomycetia bacterium]|nr:RNA-directed DNA polymerase [Planctomycetia bacterium]
DARGFVREQRLPLLYTRAHLPQGAPTSPAIANISLYKLDVRLTGLATACGATYSRYADDVAFSGDSEFTRCVDRLRHHIAAIIQEEGFHVNHRKTRIMRASTRQRIVGIVVNRHRNIARGDYDQLKAILHNCRKYGLQSQNLDRHSDYRAHLAGRVAFIEAVNPHRGQRLREILDQIQS